MALTAADIKTRVAAILGVSEGDLDASWDTLIADALAEANNRIEAILIGERGFSAEQLASWDCLDDYARNLSLYHVFRSAPDQAGISEERIRLWNVERELRSVSVLDSSGAELDAGCAATGGGMEDGEIIPSSLVDGEEYFEDKGGLR